MRILLPILALTFVLGSCHERYGPDGNPQSHYDQCVDRTNNTVECGFSVVGYSLYHFNWWSGN